MTYSLDDPPRMPSAGPMPGTPDAPLLERMGFLGFLQWLGDALDRCRRQGILFGPGRGSAVASPTLRALNIIEPGLPESDWRRFASPGKTPDVDVDVASSRRDWTIRRLDRACPQGWHVEPGVFDHGGACQALFPIPDEAAPIVRSTDARLLERHGWFKLDLLPSRELDAIGMCLTLIREPGLWEPAFRCADLSWRPVHRFLPGPTDMSWKPGATRGEWERLAAHPDMFFQFRARRHPPLDDVDSYGTMVRRLAALRPNADPRMLFQEDQIRTLVDHGFCDWAAGDRLRHASEDVIRDTMARARRTGDPQVMLAVRLLTHGYGYSKAHAIGYAAILDMEARLAARHPSLWAACLYDVDPGLFADPSRYGPLTGVWRPDPTLGMFLGGVAHGKGFGRVNACALRGPALRPVDNGVWDRVEALARSRRWDAAGRLAGGRHAMDSLPYRVPDGIRERARRAVGRLDDVEDQDWEPDF